MFLCFKCFCLINISHHLYFILSPWLRSFHRKTGDKTGQAIAWMKEYFEDHCDKMPNAEGSQSWHLSPDTRKKDIHQLYVLWVEDHPGAFAAVQLQTFYSLWADKFPHVTIPVRARFKQCDRCAELKALYKRATSRQERAAARGQMKKHRALVDAERQEVKDRIFRARNEPDKCLYVEMDSMDQEKTAIPHFAIPPKSLEDTGKVKVHVTCARVPSINKVYEYLYTNNLAHDSNTTVTVLDQVLCEIAKFQQLPSELYLQLKQVFPQRLYLQMDNCNRENKNSQMFGYLSLLVKLGIFKRIYVGFLPVGYVSDCPWDVLLLQSYNNGTCELHSSPFEIPHVYLNL